MGIEAFKDSKGVTTTKYTQGGKVHREGAPAVTRTDGSMEEWYKHGLLHREDGPAVTTVDAKGNKIEKFFLDGNPWPEGEREWHKEKFKDIANVDNTGCDVQPITTTQKRKGLQL